MIFTSTPWYVTLIVGSFLYGVPVLFHRGFTCNPHSGPHERFSRLRGFLNGPGGSSSKKILSWWCISTNRQPMALDCSHRRLNTSGKCVLIISQYHGELALTHPGQLLLSKPRRYIVGSLSGTPIKTRCA